MFGVVLPMVLLCLVCFWFVLSLVGLCTCIGVDDVWLLYLVCVLLLRL